MRVPTRSRMRTAKGQHACHRPGQAGSKGVTSAKAHATRASHTAAAPRRARAPILKVSWEAHLVPTLTLEAVIAWLDAGQPDPDHAAERIGSVIQGRHPIRPAARR